MLRVSFDEELLGLSNFLLFSIICAKVAGELFGSISIILPSSLLIRVSCQNTIGLGQPPEPRNNFVVS